MNSYVAGKLYTLLLLLALGAAACSAPEDIYEVDPITVQVQGGQKKAVKTDRQFVSGAYADVMKKQISTGDLDEAIVCYEANSDKELVTDMIIRDLLKRSAAVIPSATEMRGDISKFVGDTYIRFYKREPGDLERWTVQNQITQDTSISPVMVYYVFMTAEEYKYY